jgi:hypothetical protein
VRVNGAPRPNVSLALQVDYFHFGIGPGSERANLISSRCARWCTPAGLRLSRVAIAVALSPAAPSIGAARLLQVSTEARERSFLHFFQPPGGDQIQFRMLLFSLTLRSGRAILRYNPRLLSSWPTSSTDAPLLRSIAEAVELSFPLQPQLDRRQKCSANLEVDPGAGTMDRRS